ncbi:hypothetical protein [Flavobacterium sp. WC2430]|uniref:hypothetical protein n=1 Tax=Flavobacterium sp. WC2430 TaxID=3234137 RepID=UPI003467EA08
MIVFVNNKEYIAPFSKRITQQDLVLDNDSKLEYGNEAPVITKPKFILSPNDAVLEYKMKNKTYFFKIINLKERQ